MPVGGGLVVASRHAGMVLGPASSSASVTDMTDPLGVLVDSFGAGALRLDFSSAFCGVLSSWTAWLDSGSAWAGPPCADAAWADPVFSAGASALAGGAGAGGAAGSGGVAFMKAASSWQ